MEQVDRTAVYTDYDLLNAVIIGLMVGIYQVVGKGGTQAVINMAGEYVGKEMLRFAADHHLRLNTLDDFRDFLLANKLAGDIQFDAEESGIHARISKCRTCPKRVGHYAFDGSACPWGGILIGAFSTILSERFSYAARLFPGETCEIFIQRRI